MARAIAALAITRRRRLWEWIAERMFDDEGGNCDGHICCDHTDRHHVHVHDPSECNDCKTRRKREQVVAG